jgi:hypothetical protein
MVCGHFTALDTVATVTAVDVTFAQEMYSTAAKLVRSVLEQVCTSNVT